jgi:hypothetical protein
LDDGDGPPGGLGDEQGTPARRGTTATGTDFSRIQNVDAGADRGRAARIAYLNDYIQPVIRDTVDACAARLRKVYEDIDPALDLRPPFGIALVEGPRIDHGDILALSFVDLVEPDLAVEARSNQRDGARKKNDFTGRVRIQIGNDEKMTLVVSVEPRPGQAPFALNVWAMVPAVPTLPLEMGTVSGTLDSVLVDFVNLNKINHPYHTERHGKAPWIVLAGASLAGPPITACGNRRPYYSRKHA